VDNLAPDPEAKGLRSLRPAGNFEFEERVQWDRPFDHPPDTHLADNFRSGDCFQAGKHWGSDFCLWDTLRYLVQLKGSHLLMDCSLALARAARFQATAHRFHSVRALGHSLLDRRVAHRF
jgi:hypothetical protein